MMCIKNIKNNYFYEKVKNCFFTCTDEILTHVLLVKISIYHHIYF